ncbi:MAG: hypothetical protein COA57_16320, partial [Flavobacteriales bacterium]
MFNDSSIGGITYFWDFGDGGTSTLQNPMYIYATAGSYSVALIVSDSVGQDTAFNLINIDANPTVAAAGPDQNLCNVTTSTLAGNTPIAGTGTWSVVAGIATITTPSSPTSGVTGLMIGTSATLRWTISNGICPASIDDVIVSIDQVTATTTSTDASCDGNCDGSATAAATGGTPSYTYLWDDTLAQATATAT